MTHCPLCQAPRENRHTRGPLMTQLDPPGAWWRGMPLQGVTRRKLALLDLLCRRGKASHFAVEMVAAGEDAGIKVAAQVLHRLRRLLPPEVQIISIPGWGYELIMTEAP